MRPTFLSFFSGILGLDQGFEEAGWRCLGTNERDPDAARTIRENRPETPLLEGDIRDLDLEGLRSSLGVEPGQLDAVVGGPPCQAFSTAGRRKSLEDERGNVAMHFLALAVALRPRFIVIENVRGLLSAPLRHRPHRERGPDHPPLALEEGPGGALRHLAACLTESGYAVTWDLYDASRYGAAQRRERLVVVASLGDPLPTIAPHNEPGEARTFRSATSGIARHEHLPLRPGQRKFLPLLGPGQNWRDLPPELWPEALGGALQAGGGRVGFMRRIAWDEPSPTLVTNPTMPATLLAHPEELRPLSIQEYQRLQGFSDEWRLFGSLSSRYRQLGNAVPVPLGRAIAGHLLNPVAAAGPTSRYDPRKTRRGVA
ncbi:MAG: DNA cytosine methyltransferase [Fimbriimonadaceae bacterium]|nr:MAG: DNA cytosine methyltransferase [Fimbriimonadaceae bacterium]